MGGPDAERDVSIKSGREVAAALRKSGRFDVYEEVIARPTAAELDALPGDVVFPVLHGRWGEGGPLQELLESIGRPYVGSQPGPAALAMDKMETKRLLAREGVRTPRALEISPHDHCSIDPPLVIKPVDDGSSVDIAICHTVEQVISARHELHPRRARLMAEQFIPGRELTVGIINDGEVLPVIEILPAVEFYDYEAKYDREDTGYIVNPPLPPRVQKECATSSLVAWERLGCRDVARVDFRLDDRDQLWFLEINTMPGFTTHSLVPKAAAKIGLEMPELCASLVEAAIARSGQPLSTAVRS
jgi:D-alanine-D-alanine ligase